MRVRFHEVSTALSDAMDSLRTDLTVLNAPPVAFGPGVMALLRAERVLDSAGIEVHTQIEDEAISLQFNSRGVFSILRAMQEVCPRKIAKSGIGGIQTGIRPECF